MKCPLEAGNAHEVLLEYPTGRLDPAAQAALESHIAECFDCQEAVGGQAAVWDALDAWEPAPVTVDFNRRLWQRIDRVEAERANWFSMTWKPALPVAAAFLLLMGVFMVERPHERLPLQSATGSDGVTLTEVDQVEATLDDLQLLQQFDSATKPDNDAASRI
jgi:hypothetical protein